jgi:Gluconate 2-dehydrogenase subunit 3
VAQDSTGWDRRDFIGGAALLALALGIPAAAVKLDGLGPAPSFRQMAIIRRTAQLVIPRTDTPGAGDVRVGGFVALALAHGLEDTGAGSPKGTGYLGWLESALDRLGNGDFLRLSPEARLAALTTLDAAAYAEGVRAHPWRKLKALILTGYYTSEAGASQELQYELVPGRWVPDMPLAPTDRAWSSDWTAVEFG